MGRLQFHGADSTAREMSGERLSKEERIALKASKRALERANELVRMNNELQQRSDEELSLRKKKKKTEDYEDEAEHTKPRKKKPSVSTDYEEAFNKLSDMSLEGVETNLDLIKEMRKLLLHTLSTARGATRANPRPGNIYAMSRLSNDILMLTKAIEDSLDYNELADVIFNKVIKPFIDRSLLDLGSNIRDSLEKHAGDDERKFQILERIMTEAYRKYGASLEGKIPQMQTKLKKTILGFTK